MAFALDNNNKQWRLHLTIIINNINLIDGDSRLQIFTTIICTVICTRNIIILRSLDRMDERMTTAAPLRPMLPCGSLLYILHKGLEIIKLLPIMTVCVCVCVCVNRLVVSINYRLQQAYTHYAYYYNVMLK